VKTLCDLCICNGNLKECLNHDCPVHDTFVFKQLFTKLRNIKSVISHYKTPSDRNISKWCDTDNVAFKLYCDFDHAANYINPIADVKGAITTEPYMFDKCQHHWIDMRLHGFESGECCCKCNTLRSGNFLDIAWRDTPDYGDMIPLSDFIKTCKSFGFIDYDGDGVYAFIDKTSKKRVSPSDIMNGDIDYRFTHVLWFNR